MTTPVDPHAAAPVLAAGEPLATARLAIVAFHGRGATAADIAGLAAEVAPPGSAIVAPEAVGNTWYPYRFLEPRERNEPWLSSALALVGRIVEGIVAAGVPAERVALLGFSQGACLVSDFAARNPRRYGGLLILSGGLIGPPGTRFAYDGSLAGTPTLVGCSDVDAHIPVERVRQTADALGSMGAAVTLRIYPGMGHTVNQDEVEVARGLLATAAGDGDGDTGR